MSATPSIPKWQYVAGWVCSVLILVPLLPSASFKILQPGDFLAQWTKDFPAATARPIGIAELLCTVLYFVPRTRVLGAILLAGYLGGAVCVHVRGGDGKFFVPFLVGVIAWLGIWLRDARLRAILPLTKD